MYPDLTLLALPTLPGTALEFPTGAEAVGPWPRARGTEARSDAQWPRLIQPDPVGPGASAEPEVASSETRVYLALSGDQRLVRAPVVQLAQGWK